MSVCYFLVCLFFDFVNLLENEPVFWHSLETCYTTDSWRRLCTYNMKSILFYKQRETIEEEAKMDSRSPFRNLYNNQGERR